MSGTELDPRNLTLGKKYVLWITGIVRTVVAECVDTDDQRYHRAQLKVLNMGFMHDVVLRGEDYILKEEYDPAVHGPIENERAGQTG